MLTPPSLRLSFSAMQRYCEYEADAYSVRLGYDLRPALTKMAKKNLGDLNPDCAFCCPRRLTSLLHTHLVHCVGLLTPSRLRAQGCTACTTIHTPRCSSAAEPSPHYEARRQKRAKLSDTATMN